MKQTCQLLGITTAMQMHSCNFGSSNQCSMLVASNEVTNSHFRASICLILPNQPSACWICDGHRCRLAIFLWGIRNTNIKFSTIIIHRISSRRKKTHEDLVLCFPWVVCGCVVFWGTCAHIFSPTMANWGLPESSFHCQNNFCTLMNN